MDTVAYFVFGAIILGLISIIIMMMVLHRQDTKELRDRLMARDFHDYSVNRLLQKAKPKVMSDAHLSFTRLALKSCFSRLAAIG